MELPPAFARQMKNSFVANQCSPHAQQLRDGGGLGDRCSGSLPGLKLLFPVSSPFCPAAMKLFAERTPALLLV